MFRLFWLICLVLAPVSAVLGQGEVGAIRGNVSDGDFNVPVRGAVVNIEGLGKSAETGETGSFVISDVPPGVHTLTVAREGFRRATVRDVLVRPGAVTDRSLTLEAEIVELDEFVVTPGDLLSNDGAVDAIEIRQSLDGFADVLGSDFIARTGASDAGKLLTKVVGTSVVDSKYVVVRGLSDRYNTVYLNGARVPTSDPDRRAVNVDIFPGALIDSVVSSKTFTPDLPGEATGGHIDLGLKGIPPKDYVKLSLGVEYNTGATGNDNFLTYRGGGVGFLGRRDDRKIPTILQNAVQSDLPSASNAPRATALRAAVAEAVDPVFGVTTAEAPYNVSFAGSVGKSFEFFGGPLAIQMAVSYKKDYEFDDNRVFGETQVSLSTNQYLRVEEFVGSESSTSVLGALLLNAGWQPSPDSLVTATVFTNIAAEDSVGFYLGEVQGDFGDPGNSIPPREENAYRVKEFIEYTERRLTFTQLAGNHAFPDWHGAELGWNVNYGFSSQSQPDLRFSNYGAQTSPVTDPVTGETVEVTRFVGAGSNFSGQPFERIWRQLDDTNYSINLDATAPVAKGFEGKDIEFKFGAGFDASRREYRADNFGVSVPGTIYNRTAFPDRLDADDRADETIADVIAPELLRGQPQGGAFLFRASSPEIYQADQYVTSAFLLSNFDLSEKLNVVLGARGEATDITLNSDVTELFGSDVGNSALLIVDPLTGQQYTPEELNRPINRSEFDVLPAVSMRYDVAKDMVVRFSASRTLARPTFKELAPVFTRSPGSSRRFFGNRRLELSDITNYDIRGEWFPAAGDVIAVSLFAKVIDRPIEVVNLGNFATVVNEESASVYGAELEVQKSMGTIWPMLRGLNAGGNFSLIFSRVDLTTQSRQSRLQVGQDPVRPLQGQPDYIMNFNLTYDYEDFGLTAGLFLNITGPLLYEAGARVGNDFGLDVIQQPISTLDFNLSKKFGQHWKLTFKAGNLLDSPRSRVYPDGSLFEEYRSGRTYSIGLGAEW